MITQNQIRLKRNLYSIKQDSQDVEAHINRRQIDGQTNRQIDGQIEK